MAQLIPDVPKKCKHTERQVLMRLAKELPAGWIVIHSLGLTKHKKKVWGEIDCAVLSEKGIFAIEVKGGRVSCHGGHWTFESPDRREKYTKQEGPFEQAKDAWIALREVLNGKPEFKKLLGGYGVVMPFEPFTQTGSEIEPEVLLDSRLYYRSLAFYIGQLSAHWKAHYEGQGKTRRLPTAAELAEIRRLLRPDINSAFRLGSYLTALESELIELTEQQVRTVRGMQKNACTVITGTAGTGKTLVAIDHARRLAETQKVLYVCFNKLLAEHVASGLGEKPPKNQITVRHLHGLYRETIDRAGQAARLKVEGINETELFGEVFPNVFYEAAASTELEQYDALVIDEAQDILTVPNLDALDLLVTGGIRDGTWHLFLDPNQDIYGRHAAAAMARLEESGYAHFALTQNCRCTKQVAITASVISGMDLEIDGAIDGPDCDPIFVDRQADIAPRVIKEVEALLAADVRPQDIVILSLRRFENSSISNVRAIAAQPIVDISAGNRGAGIHFSTVHSFKGLERKVAIVIDVEGIGEASRQMLHYVALTRAQSVLKVFLTTSERPAYVKLATEFGRKLATRSAG